MSRLGLALVLLLPGVASVPACTGGPGTYVPRPEPARPPPVPPPPATGPLDIRIVYPPVEPPGAQSAVEVAVLATDSTYRMPRTDSVFVFGSVGRGDAMLFVNGHRVPVYPTGGWIAWLPLRVSPGDSVATFDLVAWAQGVTLQARLEAVLVAAFDPQGARVWIDTLSLRPQGDRWVRPGEGVSLSVRAAPGSVVRVVAQDGTVLDLLPDETPAPLPWGERAFRTGPPPARPVQPDRYRGWSVGPLGPEPGPMLAPLPTPDPGDSAWFHVEAIQGTDTARVRWPLRIGLVDSRRPAVVVVDDDPHATGATDSILAGRPTPHGTYHWFFPTGTVAVVSGRWNDQVRLQLSRGSVAWVDAQDVHLLPPGTPPPDGPARSMRLVPGERSVVLRIPLPARAPFRIEETERELRLTLYGVAADMDWVQYGGTDPFVELITFRQGAEDEATVTLALAQPVWGYRSRWDGTDLLLEVRRPPLIDATHPLRGRVVVLDPGHPPGGATGPTGVREPDVALAVALEAQQLLEAAGASVVLTRSSDVGVDLPARTRTAEQVNGEILVSIHANALPDGMNPFVNSGTSVYFFHPRSGPLARSLARALVRQFGFRDLGVGRGDLALARPTWMPAVLAEGLFMMLPDQEAVLRSDEGQRRYATGLVEGIAAFLAARARTQGVGGAVRH